MTKQVILKKVTAKSVLGDNAAMRKWLRAPENEGKKMSFDLFGIVHGTELKVTEYGESHGFSGSFRAINHQTGEVFTAGVAYLPKAAENILATVVNSLAPGEQAEVALTVAVVLDDKSNTGYVYEVSTHLAETANDPVVLLQQRIGLLQLEAPDHATGTLPDTSAVKDESATARDRKKTNK